VDFSPVHEAVLATFSRRDPTGESDVIYTPGGAGGTPVVIRGIFRSSHKELDLNSGAIVSSNQPLIGVRLADLLPSGQANRDDVVTIGGFNYTVVEVMKDGEGMATLRLNRKVP
jgi:hypothetical protein